MYLKSIFLKNFRNYKHAEVHFSPKLNTLFGENAQGKTNLLEAIYLLATGRSFRTQSLTDLIKENESFFYIEAEIIRDEVSQRVKIYFDEKEKRVHLNATEYKTFAPLLGILPTVLYTPYDIELIMGAPNDRRKFLNLHLAQSDPLYVHHLTRFWRAMKQRNVLLKQKKAGGIELFEIEMAKSTEYIKKAREKMIEEINQPLRAQGKSLTKSEEIYLIQLQSSAGKNYLEQLQKTRAKEMEIGATLTGPHRDDLTIFVNAKPAKLYASEGQKKTAVAALKFAEWENLSEKLSSPALMAFDDLGLHLDETRQSLLKEKLETLSQVFITTPFKPKLEGHHIEIKNGSILNPVILKT